MGSRGRTQGTLMRDCGSQINRWSVLESMHSGAQLPGSEAQLSLPVLSQVSGLPSVHPFPPF